MSAPVQVLRGLLPHRVDVAITPWDGHKRRPEDLWFHHIRLGGDALVVNGTLPRANEYVEARGKTGTDVLLMAEVVRQAVEIGSRTLVDAGDRKLFVLRGVDVASDRASNASIIPGADVEVVIPLDTLRVNGAGTTYGIRGGLEVRVGGMPLSASIDCAFMGSDGYADVRGDTLGVVNVPPGGQPPPGPRHPVWPLVTTPRPDAGGYRATWNGRRLDFLYDRRLDHVPGIMQGEVMRQAALAVVGLVPGIQEHAPITSASLKFVSFAEPYELLCIRAVELPTESMWLRSVGVFAHQQQRVTARAKFNFSVQR